MPTFLLELLELGCVFNLSSAALLDASPKLDLPGLSNTKITLRAPSSKIRQLLLRKPSRCSADV